MPETTPEREKRGKTRWGEDCKVERDTCVCSRFYMLGVTTKEARWAKVSDAQLHRRGRGGT